MGGEGAGSVRKRGALVLLSLEIAIIVIVLYDLLPCWGILCNSPGRDVVYLDAWSLGRNILLVQACHCQVIVVFFVRSSSPRNLCFPKNLVSPSVVSSLGGS